MESKTDFGTWGPTENFQMPNIPEYIFPPLSEAPSKFCDYTSAAYQKTLIPLESKDEEEFQVVSADSKLKKTKKVVPQAPQQQPQQPSRKQAAQVKLEGPKYKDFSCQIKNNWVLIGEINKAKFEKECKVDDGKILFTSGEIRKFDENMLKVLPTKPVLLGKLDHPCDNLAYVFDSNIEDFMNACQVIITDSALSLLLTSQLSLYPWDLEVDKIEGKIIISGNENTTSKFFTVFENSLQLIEETNEASINHFKNISIESWMANVAFIDQSLTKEKLPSIVADTTIPHKPAEFPEPAGYLYKVYTVTDEETKAHYKIGVRCRIDGYIHTKAMVGEEIKEKVEVIQIKTVLEPTNLKARVNWVDLLKKGANEIKNVLRKDEACKMTRWAMQCMISGVKKIMIGVLARTKPKSPDAHDILGTLEVVPTHISGATINKANLWSPMKFIVKCLVDRKDGKYRILKDPLRNTIKIFEAPEEVVQEKPPQ